MRFRKLSILVMMSLIVASCAGVDPGKTSADEVVRIGFQVIPNGDPVVRHERYLEETTDLEIVWLQFSSGAEVNLALQTGQIDVGLIGSNPAVIGLAGDLDYSVIWVFNLIGENEALVVDKSLELGGLAGKRIATPFGSTSHYSLLSLLATEGYSDGEVTLLDLQPQDALVAWERGDIDGAYVWNPVLARIKESGGVVIADSEQMAQRGYATADLGVVRNEFMRENPEFVQAWVEAQSRAVEFIRQSPDQAAQIVATEFGIPVPDAAEQLSQVVLLTKGEQRAFFQSPDPPTSPMFALLRGTADFLLDQERISAELGSEEVLGGFTARFLGD